MCEVCGRAARATINVISLLFDPPKPEPLFPRAPAPRRLPSEVSHGR